MEEIWRHIKSFDLYEISNFGRIRRAKYVSIAKNGKINIHHPYIHKETNSKGDYFRIVLKGVEGKRKSCSIHRLVWENFVGDIPKGYHIHHIDGNRQNNMLSNLKLLSTKEHHGIHVNEHPEILDGMRYYNKYIRPKKVLQYTLENTFIAEYANAKEAFRKTGVCSRNILQVCNHTEFSNGRYRKQAGGYIWKFKDET